MSRFQTKASFSGRKFTPTISLTQYALIGLLTLGLAACDGGSNGTNGGDLNGNGGNGGTTPDAPDIPELSLSPHSIKTFSFTWTDVSAETEYRLLENPDGLSGYTQVASFTPETTSHALEVFLPGRINASYMLQACNNGECSDSEPAFVSGNLSEAVGYIKASNTESNDLFGHSIALSTDGSTLAVGATGQSSDANNSGAVYVFTHDGTAWSPQATIKPNVVGVGDRFGSSVALSADGNTLAVGANRESSNATGINNNETNTDADNSGAVYVFTRTDTDWSQQAYIKASNTRFNNYFGSSVTLSANGNTLAVGAHLEDGNATGINGNQTQGSVGNNTGAVYVFVRDDDSWTQQAYVKSFNTGSEHRFGQSIALSADGNTLAVGAYRENSDATDTCVPGEEECDSAMANNDASLSGAVYVYTRSDTTWTEEAYVKASNTGAGHRFGRSVALAADGNTLAVGAFEEDSDATDVGGDQSNSNAEDSGAVYVFTRSGTTWTQQAYIKASNTRERDRFGWSLALAADGNTLAVGAYREGGEAVGVGGIQDNTEDKDIGAVYVFTRSATLWAPQAYVKASNTETDDEFGWSVALSGNGDTLAVGAPLENSNAKDIGGDQTNNDASNSGAVYLY